MPIVFSCFLGGGRTVLTPRFLRHFNTIGIDEFDDQALTTIFTKIMEWHITTKYVFVSDVRVMNNVTVKVVFNYLHEFCFI